MPSKNGELRTPSCQNIFAKFWYYGNTYCIMNPNTSKILEATLLYTLKLSIIVSLNIFLFNVWRFPRDSPIRHVINKWKSYHLVNGSSNSQNSIDPEIDQTLSKQLTCAIMPSRVISELDREQLSCLLK